MRDSPAPEPGGVQTIVTENAAALAEEAAGVLVESISGALSARGGARVVLAGGNTPRSAYRLLADQMRARRIDAARVSWFFGDERWVPRTHEQSNEGMAREALLGPLGAPEDTIHSWDAGWGNPVECAGAYGGTVRRLMGKEAPDVVVLGLGADGHTASLFPGAAACLPDGTRMTVGPDLPGEAAAVEGSADRGWRLTLCPRFLCTSRLVVFLVSGAEKARALRLARAGSRELPGAWIRGAETRFLVTRDTMGPETPDTFGRTRRA